MRSGYGSREPGFTFRKILKRGRKKGDHDFGPRAKEKDTERISFGKEVGIRDLPGRKILEKGGDMGGGKFKIFYCLNGWLRLNDNI